MLLLPNHRPTHGHFWANCLFVSIVIIAASMLLSCNSSTPALDQESPSLYFKAAEQARFQRKYRKAVELYKLTQLRFADNFPIILEAEFSIAQIYFSWQGHNKEAEKHYLNVVAFYDRPEIGTDVFPQSYLHLARKNLEEIEHKRQSFRLLPPKTNGVKSVYDLPTKQKDTDFGNGSTDSSAKDGAE